MNNTKCTLTNISASDESPDFKISVAAADILKLLQSFAKSRDANILRSQMRTATHMISGVEFSTAELIGYNNLHEVYTWTSETFGPDSQLRNGLGRWYFGGDTFFFRSKKDFTLFVLRWSTDA